MVLQDGIFLLMTRLPRVVFLGDDLLKAVFSYGNSLGRKLLVGHFFCQCRPHGNHQLGVCVPDAQTHCLQLQQSFECELAGEGQSAA